LGLDAFRGKLATMLVDLQQVFQGRRVRATITADDTRLCDDERAQLQ
jgi:hypothetical protein